MKDIYIRIKNLTPGQQEAFLEELRKKGIELPGIPELRPGGETVVSPAIRSKEYHATFAQKKMYDLFLANPQSTAYNIVNAWKINGAPDHKKLEQAFAQLIERHEGLRTSFKMKGQDLWQIVHDPFAAPITYRSAHNAEEVDRIIRGAIRPFNYEQLPLFEILVIAVGDGEQVVACNFSHIIIDGVALHVLFKELLLLYSGETLLLPIMQPGDYANLELTGPMQARREAAAAYWLGRFNGIFPVLHLPVDYGSRDRNDLNGEEITCALGDRLSSKIKVLAAACDCTPFAVLLAALYILLQRITEQQDIVIGIPCMGRHYPGSENMISMQVNTVALKATVHSEKPATDFIREIAALLVEAQTYQDCPFDELLGQLQVSNYDGRSPLKVLMNSQNRHANINTGPLQATPLPVRRSTSTFDLALFPIEEEMISFTCSYNTSLFKRETIAIIINAFKELLRQMSEQPSLPLNAYRMLPAATDLHRPGTKDPNDGQIAHPFVPVITSFNKIVEKHGGKTAVVHDNCHITYKALQQRASSLASIIKGTIAASTASASPARVALLFNESADMITGLIASMMAGCTFLPLDPTYPAERLNYMLADFDADILLTHGHCTALAMELASANNARVVSVDGEKLAMDASLSPEIIAVSPDHTAFVLYTSGSSGAPKGVMHTHAGFSYFIDTCIRELGLDHNDRVALFTSYTHAVGILDIFSTLLSGAALYLYKIKEKFEQLPAWILENGISIYHSVPTVFRQLLQITPSSTKYHSVRLIVLGGEELRRSDVELFNLFFGDNCVFVNFLGATEIMVVSFHFIKHGTMPGRATIPAGWPVKGVTIRITGQDGYEAGIFGTGELSYISEFVAKGYCNLPERTDQSFPAVPGAPGMRCFVSGDMGRPLPDGTIEYLGRKDRQVKLRGHRIDLSDVEVNMLKYPGITEAVVELVRRDDHDASFLQAFYTASAEISKDSIIQWLASRVPGFMIPSDFRWLNVLPLTPGDKTDRKALMRLLKEDRTVSRPRNNLEQTLVNLFGLVLALQNGHEPGIDDNFFALGGHSLKASLLVSHVKKELGIEIKIADIFQSPTVRLLAANLNKYNAQITVGIKPAEKRDFYPLSAAQKRIYFTHELDESKISYNLPTALNVQGAFDEQRFERAVLRLIERHEALRTSFVKIGNEVWQQIHTKVPFSIQYLSVQHHPASLDEVMARFVQPFDLSVAPLLRIAVIRFSPTHHWLLTDTHHVIADGTSSEIMIDDMARLYAGETPEHLTIQYTDYTNWHNDPQQREARASHGEFWKTKLSGALPRLNIVTGKKRPAVFTHEGDKYDRRIDQDLVRRVNQLCLETGCTPFMFYVTALDILLHKYSGQTDIIIGCTSFGRNMPELQPIMGLFVNALVLRNSVGGDTSFNDLLREVKATCLEAYAHQDYPFDELIQQLQLKRDPSHHPLFDVCVAFQNYKRSTGGISGLHFERLRYHNATAKFDLLFTFYEAENETVLSIEYYTAIYPYDFIVNMVDCYLYILQQALNDEHIIVQDIKLVAGQAVEGESFFPTIEFNF